MTQATAPAVWLHVSTLMRWDRPPVGIVRVEREYCLWLLGTARAAGQSVRFCVWDSTLSHFIEVAAEQVEIKLGLREVAAPLVSRQPLPTWKRTLKAAWAATKSCLPDTWAAGISRSLRLSYHHLLRGDKRVRALLSPNPVEPLVTGADFATGDSWVSLGADWEYLDQEALYRAKREKGLRVTLICYDAIPVLLPHLFVGVLSPGRFGAYLANLAWCADAVLCISECTRRDFQSVMQRMGGPQPPTHVIELGSSISMAGADQSAPPALASAGDDRPFVLYVSTIERRKNHEILYRAWTRLRDQGIVPHRLVFVGMRGWGVNDLLGDLSLDPRIQDDIVVLNHVTDEELAWLYRHCAFTVFPSLYEGWGLPVVESLAWGKLCLASNAASLPEAGGPWAEYLDPWDLPAWVERLAHYMRNPQAVAERNQRIAEEFRAPSWADTASAIHQVAMAQSPRSGPA